MTMISRRFGQGILIAVLAAGIAPAAVADKKKVTIKAFFGRFTGKAITKFSAAEYYGLKNRDTDVTIADTGNGSFRLSWKTIRYRKNRSDKVAETVMNYAPAETKGLWRAKESGDILAGKTMSWARIQGRALMVYVAGIRKETGRLHVSIYSRRLAPAGLYLQFRRIEEGRPVRFIEALLKRAK
jgi:hypothetical protein